MQTLVDESAWRDDDDDVDGAIVAAAVSDFRKMAPDVPDFKIGAAVGIRLHELDDYSRKYRGVDGMPTSESMYTTLISRAVGLSDDVTAVLPMHDMINHSLDPNVGMAFSEDGTFEIVALRDIPAGEELFFRYKNVEDEEGDWDSDKAAWLLVQWGIPSSPLDTASFVPTSEEMEVSMETVNMQ